MKRIARLRTYLRLLPRLGWGNTVAVARYRLARDLGWFRWRQPIHPSPLIHLPPAGCTQAPAISTAAAQACLAQAAALSNGQFTYFSTSPAAVGSPPDWFATPDHCRRFPGATTHWSRLPDFGEADIKLCWELSRWEWSLTLARAAVLSGDPQYQQTLVSWWQDWQRRNPVNAGPNWKCGQETAIRLLHSLLSLRILAFPTHPSQQQWVRDHLRRIAPTYAYARAQDNNHGTSEAAALFIGGAWLQVQGDRRGQLWCEQGRRALEERLERLVADDGSFSQHSLTYHRLLLDTLCQVEWWRRQLKQPPFSPRFYGRARAALHWLWQLTDPLSGDGPNLGSNDGARLYALHEADYRDFRPSLQLAAALFAQGRWLPPGDWDAPLHWLELDVPQCPAPERTDRLLADGGYALLRSSPQTWALLRLPRYRFRPAHADPLHLDLWHQGVNLFRDGGSYAYNADPESLAYFPGIASHNAVQFDGDEPMPRLGRFLFGDWLQPDGPIDWQPPTVSAAYRVGNCHHRRQVSYADSLTWQIIDVIRGWQHQACLRWRLAPADWQFRNGAWISILGQLQVSADVPMTQQLTQGWESRYYSQRSPLPVLEITLRQSPATVITRLKLA